MPIGFYHGSLVVCTSDCIIKSPIVLTTSVVDDEEAANADFIVIGLTRARIEHMFDRT